MALLMVVWMVVLLAAIAAEYSMTMRTDLLVTESVKEEAEAYYMAVAGYQAALAELMLPIETQYLDGNGQVAFSPTKVDAAAPTLLAAPVQRSLQMDTGSYAYEIADEQGKFSISTLSYAGAQAGSMSSADAFKELLRASGVQDEMELSTLVDSVVDWIDPGDEHLLNGAEDDWYERNHREQGVEFPYKTPDARRLWCLDELLLVRGFTPELLYGSAAVKNASMVGSGGSDRRSAEPAGAFLGVYDRLSVHARGAPPNRLTADPLVVAAYFPQEYEQIMALRQAGVPTPDAPPSRFFSVVATGRSLAGRTQHTVHAIVQRWSRGASGVKIIVLQWDDNYLLRSLQAPSAAPEA